MRVEEYSQHQKILGYMIKVQRDTPEAWFLPHHFMQPEVGAYFVGYEASARLSELAKEYPHLIESQRDGKYIKRRLKMDQLLPKLHLLSKDLRYVVHRAGLTAGIKKTKRGSEVTYEQDMQATLLDVEPKKPERGLMI